MTMNKRIIRTVSAALSCAFVFAACTANNGVATSETTVASDPNTALTQETVDLSGMTTETVYGSQLPQYLNHQYYFEGQPVSMTESNFYFIDTFTELTQYAGYYYPATSDGFIDLSATIDTTGMSEEMNQYNTYGDFFISYSEQMLESALIITKRANDEGLTLPDDTVAQIDEIINNIQTTGADPAGLSLDDYLSIYYGAGTTGESFRQTVYNYYLADLYTQEFIDNYEFDPEEITVPNIRYALYTVDPSTATDEDRAAAEEAANAMLEESGGDLDQFTVSGALAYTNGELGDYGEIPVPDDGSIDAAFTAWAWDESRQEGDVDVVYSENFGYFVMGYVGTTEVDQSKKDQIAVQRLSEIVSEAIDNNEYSFYTETEFLPAPTVAPALDPAVEEQIREQTLGSDATAEQTTTVGSLTGNKGIDVLLISLSVIGAVAVLGLASLGVMHLSNKKKQDDGKSSK